MEKAEEELSKAMGWGDDGIGYLHALFGENRVIGTTHLVRFFGTGNRRFIMNQCKREALGFVWRQKIEERLSKEKTA